MPLTSASAPVTVRNTEPSTRKPVSPWRAMKVKAWWGESAQNTPGSSFRCSAPRSAMDTNHTTMTGPNRRATLAVPRDCTANSPTSSTKARRVTSRPVTASPRPRTSFRPWKAPSTEMAGVMMLSP